ncbi:radical SAM/SPASM domain-containing protein [Actinomadura rubrisoli]|uniref:Radical SAM protein n=1 Tax=Actinomadura rubrisoli TaxID=2530368 RepID=A0A4R5C1M7_9ACTN|nr:radical SAM/SPASM domain-containing protein [Actinomadura rubrisoli]TDD93498.1 radical SAM protein [Actinomadura rubrisoli]
MAPSPRMLWFELSTRCQLACGHCYNSSGIDGTHGTMTGDDWRAVIGQAAALDVGMIQFIGGEPTLHPDLPALIGAARQADVEVEVYSNLVHVSDATWAALAVPGVRLATSFYSDDRDEHQQITGRDTHRQTCSHIARALEMGIPVRAGLVEVLDGQRTAQAHAMLTRMGVTHIRTDRLRPFGRAATGDSPDPAGLCGRCGYNAAAILPDGAVAACPMSRWHTVGNVRTTGLADLLTLPLTPPAMPVLGADCEPQTCMPNGDASCEPQCTPGCDPGAEE